MRFTKMQGLGNDYVYLNCTGGLPDNLPELAVRLSDRHFGVGADGLICICPSERADFGIRIFNADGSEGAMCGNGIRCVGKYVYEKGLTRKSCLTIDTDAGPRRLELMVRGGKVEQVTVDMGRAQVGPAVQAEAGGRQYRLRLVDVGNPHAVVFCEEPEAVALEEEGPLLERHPDFGARVNVEFACAEGPERLRVRVWERGSGVTLACGTGACAAFAAARREGLCGDRAEVLLPGGRLALEQRGEQIFMTGPARTVFEGETEENIH